MVNNNIRLSILKSFTTRFPTFYVYLIIFSFCLPPLPPLSFPSLFVFSLADLNLTLSVVSSRLLSLLLPSGAPLPEGRLCAPVPVSRFQDICNEETAAGVLVTATAAAVTAVDELVRPINQCAPYLQYLEISSAVIIPGPATLGIGEAASGTRPPRVTTTSTIPRLGHRNDAAQRQVSKFTLRNNSQENIKIKIAVEVG